VEDIASESSIICVTESHLDTNIIDNDILIDGFSDQILRKDRNCFGGGVHKSTFKSPFMIMFDV
jgi:hypothetical protein